MATSSSGSPNDGQRLDLAIFAGIWIVLWSAPVGDQRRLSCADAGSLYAVATLDDRHLLVPERVCRIKPVPEPIIWHPVDPDRLGQVGECPPQAIGHSMCLLPRATYRLVARQKFQHDAKS